jgi:nucleotide-binding universal stress UspA family protein
MTSTIDIPRGDQLLAELDARAPRGGPLVVGSDGTESSLPALEAAFELSRRTKSVVRVVAVLEASPSIAYEFGDIPELPDLMSAAREQLLIRVRAQVADIAGPGVEWTIDVRDGDPATEIARVATEAHARLLILGVRHRGIVDRLLARETALRTMRWSRTPVLVVPGGFSSMPTRMLFATDFTPASVMAARTALEIFPTISLIHAVHVSPLATQVPPHFVAWVPVLKENVEPGFERVRAELGAPPGVTMKCVQLEGRPSSEILSFARSAQVDLIVTGSRGGGFIDRLLMGSTSRGLVRGVPCAVLIVRAPANADVPYVLLEPKHAPIPPDHWASELQAFTSRNAGRRVSIEVDDPELGAQSQEFGYRLLGAAYDHHDRRVEIMVGDFKGTARHLTRGIDHVHSIDLLRDAGGRDWILRITHGEGQTILTLHREPDTPST